jgi:hypothetical protein
MAGNTGEMPEHKPYIISHHILQEFYYMIGFKTVPALKIAILYQFNFSSRVAKEIIAGFVKYRVKHTHNCWFKIR